MYNILRGITALAVFFSGAHGFAQAGNIASKVVLERSVFIERQNDSGTSRMVNTSTQFRSGDAVILVVRWNAARNTGFAISSAIPATLNYEASSADSQIVSVDGGRSWGALATRMVSDRHRSRQATARDVTHLKWHISARDASRGTGQLTYRAIVRRAI